MDSCIVCPDAGEDNGTASSTKVGIHEGYLLYSFEIKY